jgi:hypothetical protein
VAQRDARAGRGGAVLRHEAGPAVDRADRQAAPEAVATACLEGLALVHEPQADAVPRQPGHDVAGVAHEDARHRLVAAAQRHAAHVGEELLLRVRREVRPGQRLLGEQLAHVLQPLVRDADRARGEGGVAARPGLVGLLEHEHASAALVRGVRGGQAGVAGAGDDDVPVGHRRVLPHRGSPARPGCLTRSPWARGPAPR